MKRIVLLLLVVAAIVGSVFGYRYLNAPPKDRILVSGNIELEQVNVGFKTAGKLVERTVNEGDTVQKDQIIAKLDQDQLLRQREREMAGLAEAQAQLSAADFALQEQTQTVAADLDARKADLTTTQSRLAELKSGARPEEIAEADQAVASAQSEFDHAKKDWDRAQVLHKDDDISTSQYDQFRSRFDSAQAQLEQAKSRAKLLHQGNRSEDIDQAQAQVIKASASVRGSEASALDVKRREADVAAHEADIQRERAQIALIDSQLADTVARSPISGVVLVKSVDPGEIIAPGTSVVTVGDLDHPWVRTYIKETDIGRVKIGSEVDVKTDSGKHYKGRVTFLSSDAEFTPKQIQTTEERVKLVYRIKIELENPNHELKSNMPVDGEILVR